MLDWVCRAPPEALPTPVCLIAEESSHSGSPTAATEGRGLESTCASAACAQTGRGATPSLEAIEFLTQALDFLLEPADPAVLAAIHPPLLRALGLIAVVVKVVVSLLLATEQATEKGSSSDDCCCSENKWCCHCFVFLSACLF